MATEHAIPVDEAVDRLDVIPDYDAGDGAQPCVHTFATSRIGLLGAHWSLDSLRDLMEKHGVELAGEEATAMRHGLVVLRPKPLGPLFLATKPIALPSPCECDDTGLVPVGDSGLSEICPTCRGRAHRHESLRP